jgi:hypothetical protein
MEKFRAFIWKGKKAKVRWEVLVKKTEEGGVGLRDPMCVIDAGKIRTLINLITKDRQPWMRWVERKLKRVARRWKVEEAMAARPSRRQLRELRTDCMVESSLGIWFEIGGGGRGPVVDRQRQPKTGGASVGVDLQHLPTAQVEEKKVVEISGLGMTGEDGKWTPIERVTGRQAYDRLIQKRMRIKNYEPSKIHKTIMKLQKKLTADERNYWWRLAHKTLQMKKRQSKWRRGEDGELVKSTCPACKEAEEDWHHYNSECKVVVDFREKVATYAGREHTYIDIEWQLEADSLSTREMVLIAKARWIHHCARCNMDRGERRSLYTTALMNRLSRRAFTRDRMTLTSISD